MSARVDLDLPAVINVQGEPSALGRRTADLRAAGLRVIEAADGRAALKALDLHQPSLMIIASPLPDMEPEALALEVRRRRPAAAVLAAGAGAGTPWADAATLDPASPELPALAAALIRQRLAEQGRRRAEERSRLMVDSATDYAILTLDASGLVTSWDAGAEALFGWREAEMLGQSFERLFTEEDRAAGIPARALQRSTEVGRAEEEGWRVRRDGERFWCAARMLPLRRGEGFLKVLRDCTEQRREEELLRLSEERFRTLADTMPQLAWIGDQTGEAIWYNKRWYEFTGRTELGTRPERLALIHDDDRQRVKDTLSAAIAAGADWEQTFQMRGADGRYRWFLARGAPINQTAPQGSGRYFGTHTDITTQREAEAALAEETRLLEILNRATALMSGEIDLDRVVQAATDAGLALTGARFGAFFYNKVDASGESYTLYTLSGADLAAFAGFPMPRNTAVFEPTFRGQGLIRSDDITADSRYGRNDPYFGMPAGHPPVKSYLAAPVSSRSGEILGGLFFGHPDPGVFPARIEKLVEAMAAQAAVAIDNARLHAAAQHELAERRRVEAALRAAEARARTLTETLPQLVWTTLPDGAVDYFSPQWIDYTGVPEAQQLGDGWLNQVHPDDREPVWVHWQGAVAGLHPYDVDYRIRRHDGAWRWFKTRGAAIRGEDGEIEHWFGTCTDIQDIIEARETLARSRAALEAEVEARTADVREAHERLRAEIAERRQAEEALHQAQKMEAIGQLTGGVAHDFNNLLTAVTGNLELIQRRLAAGQTEVGRFVDGAMASAKRGAALTQRLLAFSRRQALSPKSVDLRRLVEEMSELVRRTVTEQVRLEVVAEPGLWRTWCDPNQMESGLLNLAINARDAMPDGGVLTLATHNQTVGEAESARLDGLAVGDYVVLTVSDTGIGMEPEVVARAFDPFFTTKPIGQGTGLGLSQLYGFAKQSGGHVHIQTAPGEGASIAVYLPRRPGPVEPEGSAPVQHAAADIFGHAETVLVVEDEAPVRALAAQTLEEAGYRVIMTGEAQAALTVLTSTTPIDLLLTDIGLPGMNGHQLAEAARLHRPGLKVLFVTGYAHNAPVSEATLGPGMGLLAKPFPLDALVAKVGALLNG